MAAVGLVIAVGVLVLAIDETPTLQGALMAVGVLEAGALVGVVIYLASSFTTAGWGG